MRCERAQNGSLNVFGLPRRRPNANRIDPDNRLVAAELERRWEAALSEVRAAEEAVAQQSSPQNIVQMGMGKGFQDKVISLAGRRPQIWTTQPARMLSVKRYCVVSLKRSSSTEASTTSR